MKITWLGQAGLLFETCGKTVIVDPYLSDSVARINPNNKRRVPTDERFLELKPDFLVLTHAHLDHTDPIRFVIIWERIPRFVCLRLRMRGI